MAYTTQENVENYLGRSLTDAEVALFNLILASVENYINDEVGGTFDSNATASTRYYDGGSRLLEIDPFYELTSVQLVDSLENVDYTYVLNDEFEARPRNETVKYWIESRIGKFPSGVANIAVTAKFGLGAIPDDITLLATYLMAAGYSEAIKGELTKESIEGYSREFKSYYKDDSYVNSILDRYRDNDILI